MGCWEAKQFTGQDMNNAPKYKALYDYASSHTTGNYLKKNNRSEIIIYPNPIQSKLNIECYGTELRQIALLNSAGKIMIQKEISYPARILDISTNAIASGCYILHILTKDNVVHNKLIIKQ